MPGGVGRPSTTADRVAISPCTRCTRASSAASITGAPTSADGSASARGSWARCLCKEMASPSLLCAAKAACPGLPGGGAGLPRCTGVTGSLTCDAGGRDCITDAAAVPGSTRPRSPVPPARGRPRSATISDAVCTRARATSSITAEEAGAWTWRSPWSA